MLTDLRATNFRRYDELELHLPDDAQLIAVTGPNGSGKSTLVEMILFALYGEARYGRRNLERMVRRGAEYEGLDVELGFTLGHTNYRIRRRLKNGVSSAALYGDGTPLYETPSGVNNAIEHLFGLDATSFKLATVARQKELDGLATLTPAKRVEKLSRLLRLDVLKQARNTANDDLKRYRERLHALDTAPNLDALDADVAAHQQTVEELTTALTDCDTRITDTHTQLAAVSDLTAAHDQAVAAHTRATATWEAATGEQDRITTLLNQHTVPPPPPTPEQDRDTLEQRRSQLEQAIAQAEARKENAEHLAVLTNDRERAAARLEEIGRYLTEHGTPEQLDATLEQLDADIHTTTSQLHTAETSLAEKREQAAAARSRHSTLTDRKQQLTQLEAVCPTCDQPIGDDHRHTALEMVEQQLTDAHTAVTTAEQHVADQMTAVRDLQQQRDQLHNQRQHTSQQRFEAERVSLEIGDLQERIAAYDEQLQTTPPPIEDLRPLYRERASIRTALQTVAAWEETTREREAAQARQHDLEQQLAAAQTRVTDAQQLVHDTTPDPALAAAADTTRQLQATLSEETDIRAAVDQELAVARERLNHAHKERERGEKLLERRRHTEHQARVRTLAKDVLGEAHTRISGQVRPALEGTVAELLARMSSGRFTDVRLDDAYELSIKDVTVEDDGSEHDGYYPLSEFSGGEQDLIALAMRLAIAGVVAERHGTSGPGFVLLDETFGSQDSERRGALLDALRSLRTHYDQIMLISHVPGIDASADLVLNVTPSRDVTRSSIITQ